MHDATNPETKVWLVVRKDLAIPGPKLAVQSGHAFFRLALLASRTDPRGVEEYVARSEPKIVVGVDGLAGLRRCLEECQAAGLPCVLVEDEGRTVFPEPTVTVMAVGPCRREQLPKYVARLQMLKETAS
jgi:Uncharacterized conserved protein